MKHIYKNLMIWVVSLFGMSLTAQTVADKHKAMLPQSGKQCPIHKCRLLVYCMIG